MTSGIHHITLLTRKVQANVDFYAGFLGLRLVKRTGGYEDAEQLHLFYGDSEGSPGSLLTFFAWEDGSPGRVGLEQVGEIALAVPPSSIGFWLTRALHYNVRHQGPSAEFGEPVLRLTDPDGIVVKLVGAAIEGGAPPWSAHGIDEANAVRRIRGATLFTDVPDQTSAFLTTYFGYRHLANAGAIERLVSQSGDVIDVRDATGFWPGAPGTGVADHVAFRTPDRDQLEVVERALRARNSSIVNVHDRKYYYSMYVRAPGNILFELATDGPGLTVDETLETLGSRLMIPPERQAKAEAIKVMLPQFSMPDEDRIRYADLPFVHRFHTPPDPDGSTIVLLHGSAGSEADLMPMAARIAPRATLVGVRGRATEEGIARWFRRDGPLGFDQDDIRSEARAFEAFVEGMLEAYGIDPARTTFLGYSNGANFLLAAMQFHPGLVRSAIALRPATVLAEKTDADLSGSRVLVVLGRDDALFHHQGDEVFADLTRLGADTALAEVPLGHELGDADIEVAGRWLAQD
ncbi:Glyoxalase family protein [Devosia sp. H5989]|nr:Glyoxalase family protein [Devosia sp. H5989]